MKIKVHPVVLVYACIVLVYSGGKNHDAWLGTWLCMFVLSLFSSWKNLFLTSLIISIVHNRNPQGTPSPTIPPWGLSLHCLAIAQQGIFQGFLGSFLRLSFKDCINRLLPCTDRISTYLAIIHSCVHQKILLTYDGLKNVSNWKTKRTCSTCPQVLGKMKGFDPNWTRELKSSPEFSLGI